MARIIGGIGTSHVPTIGIAFDKGKQDDPDWKPLFKGYEAVAKWLAERKPDVLFFCFNDHATTFFFDHYPTFALRLTQEYPLPDHSPARPRLAFAAAHDVADQAGPAREGRAARGQRPAAPAAQAGPLLQARHRAEKSGRVLSRGPQGGRRRHRRPVAPDDRRARRVQQ